MYVFINRDSSVKSIVTFLCYTVEGVNGVTGSPNVLCVESGLQRSFGGNIYTSMISVTSDAK